MRALGTVVVAVLCWGVGVATGLILMAQREAPTQAIPAPPMPDPPRWERAV